MVTYVENLKEPTKEEKLLKVIANIAKFQETRLIYKSQLLSYIPAMNGWNL